jgi:DNA polymerase-3 subunit gamma/tau
MTQRTLAHILRPRRFSDLLGQSALTSYICQQYKSEREPAAWMFEGPTGTGKTTIARILALSLQCRHGSIGNPCDVCWKEQSSFQIQEVNASEVSGVQDVGQMVQGSVYMPAPPSRRNIFILDEAQRLSRDAQNLLLKYFEDTPMTTVWMVCTTAPNKINDALRGRCQTAKLRPLQTKDILELVTRALKAVKSDKKPQLLADALCEEEVQYPRLILNAVERYVGGMKSTEAAKDLVSSVDSKAICIAVARGDWNVVRKQVKDLAPDELRGVRAQVAGYLRKALQEMIPTPRATEMAKAISIVAKVDSFTDATQGPATVGCLYELCNLFAGPQQEEDDVVTDD